MIGCETRNVEQKDSEYFISGREIRIYTVDGCEYIGNVYGSNGDFLTHKGNCKNPIHKLGDTIK